MSEPEDFRAFVEARWPALVRYAHALTGDRGHAEDVVQQALEKCWRRWRFVRSDGAEAYVRTAVVRLVISRWRARRITEAALEAAGEPAVTGPEDGVVLHDALWRALAGLPPRMRALVVLRYVENLTESETARLLDCSVGTVKSQTWRALARLRAEPMLTGLDLSQVDSSGPSVSQSPSVSSDPRHPETPSVPVRPDPRQPHRLHSPRWTSLIAVRSQNIEGEQA